MKKIFFVAIATLLCTTQSFAQPRAIGGRFGTNLEFSYQHTVGSINYLQLDAGFYGYGRGLSAVGTYNWIVAEPNWTDYGNFEVFAGVGAGVGLYRYPTNYYDVNTGVYYSKNRTGSFVGAAGNVGLAYNFPFPLQLSADIRPLVGFYFNEGNTGFFDSGLLDLGLSVRYYF
ncbi:MAG: hypothetical protein CSA89_00405 [Bacteroidales bacterium]|nr:MAG: hypothetical protein CSA89_00405 [Bacteroidales bacterium]